VVDCAETSDSAEFGVEVWPEFGIEFWIETGAGAEPDAGAANATVLPTGATTTNRTTARAWKRVTEALL
jgi:hypothetical protein